MFGFLWSSGFRMALVPLEVHIDISSSTPTSKKTPTIIKKIILSKSSDSSMKDSKAAFTLKIVACNYS